MNVASAQAGQSTVDSTIVVAYDGSPGGRAALAWALAEGARRRRPLRLVYVLDPERPVHAPWLRRGDRIEAEFELTRVAVEANHWGRAGMDITSDVREGSPAEVLRALSGAAGIIVVGDRGHSSARPLGSVAQELATHACGTVVIVRRPLRMPDRRPIVVGVDDDPLHQDAVQAAYREAVLRRVGLVAVRTALQIAARDAQLVVVRSAREQLLDQAPCSVMIVRK
jgi:nucleotide-binding universal stress UspA family protein